MLEQGSGPECWQVGRWSHLAPDREEPGESGTSEQEEAAVDPASA